MTLPDQGHFPDSFMIRRASFPPVAIDGQYVVAGKTRARLFSVDPDVRFERAVEDLAIAEFEEHLKESNTKQVKGLAYDILRAVNPEVRWSDDDGPISRGALINTALLARVLVAHGWHNPEYAE